MQRIELIISTVGLLAPPIPLRYKLLEVVVDVLLKLTNTLCAEGMRNRLAFASVFSAISCIEETPFEKAPEPAAEKDLPGLQPWKEKILTALVGEKLYANPELTI